IELEKHIETQALLERCIDHGVVFLPGNAFYTDHSGNHTLRLGFSRLTEREIIQGIQIIGDTIKKYDGG
ncbi:PLP-dependent aminotransferase family protein, partial [Brevibacterium sp. SIMBA_078]